MNNLVIVVIPYYAPGAQGNELALAIAGWKMHFKHPNFKIVLTGENLPHSWDDDEQVVCVESKRVGPKDGSYRQHLDYVSCFRKVHKAFPDTEGMIFVADDCYAVNDFDLVDVQVLKMHSLSFAGMPSSANGWRRDMAKTRALLDREALPHRNFTTHLPQWYEWSKLLLMWDLYDMDHESYVFENVYYNLFFESRRPVLLDNQRDNFRLGVWSQQNITRDVISDAMKCRIWITNSVEGWTPMLEKMLSDHYMLTL